MRRHTRYGWLRVAGGPYCALQTRCTQGMAACCTFGALPVCRMGSLLPCRLALSASACSQQHSSLQYLFLRHTDEYWHQDVGQNKQTQK